MPMSELSNAEIEVLLDKHLVRIVNWLRDTLDVDDPEKRRIALIADFTGCPQWLILRIGRDAHLLTDEEKQKFESL